MQWLIDLIKEWVQAQGYLTTGFVDRGDPENADFEAGDFIKDSSWRNLDLSGIVPTTAKAVLFALDIIATTTHEKCRFRKKGNVFEKNMSSLFTQVAYISKAADMVCPIGTDGLLEYNIDAATWGAIRFTVKGWWF